MENRQVQKDRDWVKKSTLITKQYFYYCAHLNFVEDLGQPCCNNCCWPLNIGHLALADREFNIDTHLKLQPVVGN